MKSSNDIIAPIIDEVNMNFQKVQFNGTFVHENIYRQDASPEVDEAWEALGIGCKYADTFRPPSLLTFGIAVRPIVVSDALAAKSGLGKNHVRINDQYGGGYPVFVEGLHQLHCLVSDLRSRAGQC